MSIEVMKQALGALDAYMNASDSQEDARAHTMLSVAAGKLRTAIIEAEKQEAWNPSDTSYRPGGLPQDFIGHESVAWPCEIEEADFEKDTVTLKMLTSQYVVRAGKHWLSTTPPAAPVKESLTTQPAAQRHWVGLTDEEIEQGCKESWVFLHAWQSAVRWSEAKLKEKNT
jgi:hypothetical protein